MEISGTKIGASESAGVFKNDWWGLAAGAVGKFGRVGTVGAVG